MPLGSTGSALRRLTNVLRVLIGLALSISFTHLAGQNVTADEVLTNEAIVQMVKGGLSAEVIIEEIRRSPEKFSLTPSGLIKLKQSGVADRIISAMQSKRAVLTAAPAAAPAAPGAVSAIGSQAGACPQTGEWRVDRVHDQLSQKDRLEGSLCQRTVEPEEPGTLLIKAACDSRSLKYEITFLSDTQPGIGIKHSMRAFGDVKPWVEMRVRVVEGGIPFLTKADSDYPNSATLTFLRAYILSSAPRTPEPTDSPAGTARHDFDSVEHALRAKSILVEFSTEHGVKHVIELKPQDSSFRSFASSCQNRYWAPPEARLPEAAADGFNFLHSIDMKDRLFDGTAEGFAAQFPALAERIVRASGLSNDYSKEVAFVVKAVRTCGEITPAMARSVPMRKRPSSPNIEVEELEKLGPQYEMCDSVSPGVNVSQGIGLPNNASRRGIVLLVEPGYGGGGWHWRDASVYSVSVYFYSLPGDEKDLEPGQHRDSNKAYSIIRAEIKRPQ